MRKLLLFATIVIVILNGCSAMDTSKNQGSNKNMETDHSKMQHSDSKQIPTNIKKKLNPTYKLGTRVVLKDGHMEGMTGAIATITGAYDTTAYVVSYTPTTGGEVVKNHKWVVQEEIKNAKNNPLKNGMEVILEANHMKGMKGAEAIIESSYKTTVYMVDYTPTTGGEKVKNHKWVTESELSLP